MENNKIKCPYCGSYDVIKNIDGTFKCKDCGQDITPDLKNQSANVASNLLSSTISTVNNVANNGAKSRIVAALLAFFLGYLGAQYFYLGSVKKGVVCILVSCTIIGLFITETWGVISGIRFLAMSNEDFNKKYSSK